MKDPSLDPETLAALLDGRLDDASRAALLARLADDDEARAVLADAAAVLGELEGVSGEAEGVKPRPAALEPVRLPSVRARWPRRWLAAAAVLVAVALVPAVWLARGGGAADPVGRSVAMLDGNGALPPGWADAPWPATRSAVGPLTEESRAGRLGVRLAQLELALAVGDPAGPALAGEIAVLLDGVPAAGPVADRYRQIAGEGGASEAALREGRRAVAGVVDRAPLELGAWAAAARVAAGRGDAGFFRHRGVLERAAADESLSPRVRAEVERVLGSVEAGVEGRWGQLAGELARLVGVLGGR